MPIIEVDVARPPIPMQLGAGLGGHVVLFGYSLAEASGAAGARVDLFDGADAAGLLAIPIPLGVGMAAEEWFGPQGIHFRGGLFARVTAGAVVGSLFIMERQDGLL